MNHTKHKNHTRGENVRMLARLKSEIAYVGGIVRALKRTRPIAENRHLTLGDDPRTLGRQLRR